MTMQGNFNIYRCCFLVFVLLINTASSDCITEGFEGDSILLQCIQRNVEISEAEIEVHWRHNDIRNVYDIIHTKISLKEQDPAYKDRASVELEECITGNFSLKIENLQQSDEGMYLCFVPSVNVFQNVYLVVKERTALSKTSFETHRVWLRSCATHTRLGLVVHLILVTGFILKII